MYVIVPLLALPAIDSILHIFGYTVYFDVLFEATTPTNQGTNNFLKLYGTTPNRRSGYSTSKSVLQQVHLLAEQATIQTALKIHMKVSTERVCYTGCAPYTPCLLDTENDSDFMRSLGESLLVTARRD
jgi:hypothetical protein